MSQPYPASYSPLLLQAQITLPSGGGEIGLADTTRLENPFQGPMWLDEIRFRLPAPFSPVLTWASISCRLKLGNLPLTQNLVPIGLFGKVLNDSGTAEHMVDDTVLLPRVPDLFTWKLPKPLFIPARELLRPTFYLQTFPGAPSQVVTVCYACRPLPVGTPTPRRLQLPWVASFVPPMLATGSDRTDVSTPADLYNPWDQDLHVQRFNGRFMVQGNTIFNQQGEEGGNMTLASVEQDLETGLVTMGTVVQAQDSFNNILVRDPTPFQHVFDMVDRAWTVNAILPPKGFYTFTMDRLWAAYTGQPITATCGISMVGWREVDYAS